MQQLLVGFVDRFFVGLARFWLFFVEAEDLCYLHKNINDQSGDKEKMSIGRVDCGWET